MEQELQRVWGLVLELSEQLTQNTRIAEDLQKQIQTLKSQAEEAQKGHRLRRFNTDLTKEVFYSDNERNSVALIIENQTLLQEHKQLNALMREYEQTLETVMTKFRTHAHVAAQHEQTLIRHYETLATALDGQPITQTYDLYTVGASLERLQLTIQRTLKCMAGEDEDDVGNPKTAASETAEADRSSRKIQPDGDIKNDLEALASALAGLETGAEDEGDDWAAEREIEIHRLERENEELRKKLNIWKDPNSAEEEEPWVRPMHTRQFSNSGYGQRHSRSSSTPFGLGITTSQAALQPPPPQQMQQQSSAYGIVFPSAGTGGFAGPHSQPQQLPQKQKSIFLRPNGAPAPGIVSNGVHAQGTFGDAGGSMQNSFNLASFQRGNLSRDRMDLSGGQGTLL